MTTEFDSEIVQEEVEVVQKVPGKRWKFVTHQRPDVDALVCMWAAEKFIARKGDKHREDDTCNFSFAARAGERLPPEFEEGFDEVLYMDTGGGDLDQHNKHLPRASSFLLLCEKYGLVTDPGIQDILEMTIASDNIEDLPWTDTSRVLKGLRHHFWKKGEGVNWADVRAVACILLDVLYGQARGRDEARQEYQRYLNIQRAEGRNPEWVGQNGIKVAYLFFYPKYREAAFEAGADVVVAMAQTPRLKSQGGLFYPIIQVHRHSKVKLRKLIAEIRSAEAQERKIPITKEADLFSLSAIPELGAWFLHDSYKLVACGTGGHELETMGEFTKLKPGKIFSVVRQTMGDLSSDVALVNQKR